MELLISKKIILALILLASISFYVSFTFNSCVVSSLSKAIPKWHIHPVVPNEIPLVHYTSVRVVSLLEGNETDISPKYKFFREQGLRPERQLPRALIIGVKKGGTRALLEFIRIHPDVRAAGSEVHFFDKNYMKGFQWYRSRMPATLEGQLTIEKTPSYFITREAPRRVQLMNPSTKLLVVVRDPVTRAISDYAQAVSKKPEMKRFERLVFVNGSVGSIVDTSWGPVKLGIYSRTPLHWAYKRGNDNIVKILTVNGADHNIRDFKGQLPSEVSSFSGDQNQSGTGNDQAEIKFTPNYLRNPPLSSQVELGNIIKSKHTDFARMPTTSLPTSQNDDLVLKVRVQGSIDPDFIEVEIPRWRLTYNTLLKICCSELCISEDQVDRIRKLPNTRLRRDNDVKRLKDYQALEIVLNAPLTSDKSINNYQSISTCKNQTILY